MNRLYYLYTKKLTYWLLGLTCLLSFSNIWAASTVAPPITIPTNIKITWNDQSGALEDNIKDATQGMIDALLSKHVMPSLPLLVYQTRNTIKDAMAPYGYFSPTVLLSETRTKTAFHLSATITPNKPVIVRKIHITVLPTKPLDAKIASLADAFPLKPGDILNTTDYESFKKNLLTTSSHRGYFDAHLTKSVITINKKAHWADITITFNPGQRYQYGTIVLHNSYLSQRFLKRFINMKKGAWFDADDTNVLQENLQATHYFSLVNMETHLNHKTNKVNIDVQLKLGNRYHYNVGVGYGTDTKERALLGMSIMPLNRRGHSATISTKLAQNHTLINAIYIIPGKDPINTQYTLFTRLFQENISNVGSSEATTLGVTNNHTFYPWHSLVAKQNIQLYALNERYAIVNGPLAIGPRSTSMMVGTITYSLGTPQTTHSGSYAYLASLTLSGAHQGLASKVSFLQLVSNIQFLKTIRDKWRFLIGNEIGFTDSPNLNQVPFSLQLLAGGNDTMRGYDYKSIGPESQLFTADFELQREIKSKWYLGVFYDMASVSNHLFKPLIPGVTPSIYQSVGPSLTRTTPLGALSISIARALSDPNHQHWSIEFNWGQTL